eukprot:TRINITY_DN25545_c0_g1_i1.p1 TRINITY_DN25545_c0_g1~~TRINITY_DN25545_c0_g1_i1.p1  ORF type:complete len:164 (-),score=4.27 TRINITY_DN25545_c0_g1_i1:32-496(-)
MFHFCIRHLVCNSRPLGLVVVPLQAGLATNVQPQTRLRLSHALLKQNRPVDHMIFLFASSTYEDPFKMQERTTDVHHKAQRETASKKSCTFVGLPLFEDTECKIIGCDGSLLPWCPLYSCMPWCRTRICMPWCPSYSCTPHALALGMPRTLCEN